MRFNKLLEGIGVDCTFEDEVMGISDRSQEIEKGWLFIALQGMQDNGENYIEEVIAKGGIVLSENRHDHPHVFQVAHLRKQAMYLLEQFYDHPCDSLHLIAVCGTAGKTSVSTLLARLLEMNGKTVMLVGTNGIFLQDVCIKTGNTTPSIYLLMRKLYEAKQLHVSYVVMEVSSHAIATHRIGFLKFDAIIYTHITSDHLDFHLTPTQYRYTKFKLRYALKPDGLVFLHNDDCLMREFYTLNHHKMITYGLKAAHFCANSLSISDHDSSFYVQDYFFHTHLISQMNVLNLLAVIAYGRSQSMSYTQLQTFCEKAEGLAGRLECICARGITIWIDYAHTTDALLNLLKFAQEVKKRSVITVVGCGGDRDRQKRPDMARCAYLMSDLCVFTADNPRKEPLRDILAQMCPQPRDHAIIIEDRACAIKHAVKMVEMVI